MVIELATFQGVLMSQGTPPIMRMRRGSEDTRARRIAPPLRLRAEGSLWASHRILFSEEVLWLKSLSLPYALSLA
jgi:hypothetical protein